MKTNWGWILSPNRGNTHSAFSFSPSFPKFDVCYNYKINELCVCFCFKANLQQIHDNQPYVMLWIPWWKNVKKNNKKKREEIFGPVQRREYLGSVYRTRRHFSPEHNGCCEVAHPLSIVRLCEPHPVLPYNTSPPLLLKKKKKNNNMGWTGESWTLSVFIIMLLWISVRPWFALPGWWDLTLPKDTRGERRRTRTCLLKFVGIRNHEILSVSLFIRSANSLL